VDKYLLPQFVAWGNALLALLLIKTLTGWHRCDHPEYSPCVCLCVRYVPSLWVDQLDNLPEVGKNEINIVNQQLVNRLKSTDTAFSLGVYIPLHTYRHTPHCTLQICFYFALF